MVELNGIYRGLDAVVEEEVVEKTRIQDEGLKGGKKREASCDDRAESFPGMSWDFPVYSCGYA